MAHSLLAIHPPTVNSAHTKSALRSSRTRLESIHGFSLPLLPGSHLCALAAPCCLTRFAMSAKLSFFLTSSPLSASLASHSLFALLSELSEERETERNSAQLTV